MGKKELSINASIANICLAYLYPAQAMHLSYNFFIIFLFNFDFASYTIFL